MILKMYIFLFQMFCYVSIILCQCTNFEANIDYKGDDLKSFLTDSIGKKCAFKIIHSIAI